MSSRTLKTLGICLLLAGGAYTAFFLRDEIARFRGTPPVSNTATALLRLDSPVAGETVRSPLTVRGEARGFWFFEASFPVVLVDDQGREIAHGIAQAQSEWMTEDFVPFVATLSFETPAATEGSLILKKDNPSGDLAHDAQIALPVRFSR